LAKMSTLSGIAGLNRALRKLPKETKATLTDASKEIAEDVAADARARAARIGRGWKHLGPTIRAEKSSKPGVKMGGSRRLKGRKGSRQTVGDLLWGTEFGGRGRPTTQQFLPHLGLEGYALWPAVRGESDNTAERYSEALMSALESMAP